MGAHSNQNQTGKFLILFATIDYHLKIKLTQIDFMCGCWAYIATIKQDIVGWFNCLSFKLQHCGTTF